jgi:hypothetical protein
LNKRRTALIVALLIAVSSVALVLGAWYLNRPVTMHGIVVAFNDFKVYSDPGCTVLLTDLDWGSTLHHGDVVAKELYIKNVGDQLVECRWNNTAAVTGLSFSAQAAGQNWNQNTPYKDATNIDFAPGVIAHMTLTMTVSGTIPFAEFTTTLNIYGSQA